MSIESILCLGLNHITAPVAVRESLHRALTVLLDDLEPEASHSEPDLLAWRDVVQEWALIPTCNRLELYLALSPGAQAERESEFLGLLKRLGILGPEVTQTHLYSHHGIEAADHLCRVATGLDSMVLGESEILGQVRGAYRHALAASTLGPHLRPIFETAVCAGKRARAETAIGRNPASMNSAAIALAVAKVGDLHSRRILLIGMGAMGRRTLKALRERGLTDITLINRSEGPALDLASAYGCIAKPWSKLVEALAEADVALTATSATQPIIDKPLLERSLVGRQERDLTLIDLAVPRDIRSDVSELPGVRLFDVDALTDYLDEALGARRREVPNVEAIVAEELSALKDFYLGNAMRPIIVDLRHRAEQIRLQELERALRYIGKDIDSATLEHIHYFSHALVNRLLHEPTIRLREKANDHDASEYAAAVRQLFGLAKIGGEVQ